MPLIRLAQLLKKQDKPQCTWCRFCSSAHPMFDDTGFRHLGGGRKGLFLLLRYLFIISASYLLIFQSPHPGFVAVHAVMIAAALASNVALSLVPQEFVFSWYVEAPVLIADTLWVSWALHSTGMSGQELFLLYFFVLFLAALGESLLMVLLGSTLVSAANIYFASDTGPTWTSPNLLRIAFFYTVALFYGHVISQIKRERQRADKGFAWAKELEATVAKRTAELSRLYNESLAASRLKSEFMANMSHELRTPLTIIMGYAEMLLDKDNAPGPEERQQMLSRICEAARDQAHLVDSLLDLGKVEAGKMPVDNEPVRLERFVAELQSRQRMQLAPGVELQWDVPANLPLIETDQAKLAMVLDNLINNAIKFTSAGSIRVGIRDDQEKNHVEFCVEDTGPGIDQKDLPTIFEAFRQVDGSTTRVQSGVGLGLAIVRSYVGLLGGEITVRSVFGRGSTFTVTLPYRSARPLSAPVAQQPWVEPQLRVA
jgi:signal transduction histidine kinase